MNVLILTYGTRGDVQPYIALGKGLQAAGHEVTLGTSERFETFVKNHGLRYGLLSDDMLRIIDSDQGREMLENTRNILDVFRRILTLKKQIGPMQKRLMQESWEVAQAVDPDLILFHPKAYGAPHFAEKLKIPVIMALLVPMFVPTSQHPMMGIPNLGLGGAYNRMSYRLGNLLMGLSAGKHVNDWRVSEGLASCKKFDVLHTPTGNRIPVVHGYSRHVWPRPRDWPEDAVVSGYWFLDGDDDWKPTSELREFLDKGPPPIYVGFGSMASRRTEQLTDTVLAALEQVGMRGIIATGWGGLEAHTLPDSTLQLDHAPHSWLFTRVSAVIHHGGAGTTAAGLRAGRPTIVIPFFGDQPYWGKRLHQLGSAAKPIPQRQLNENNLAAAIREVTSKEAIIHTSAELAQRIQEEDGISSAVAFVERHGRC